MLTLVYVRGNGRNARRVEVNSNKTGTIAILEAGGFVLEKPSAPAKAKAKADKASRKNESE